MSNNDAVHRVSHMFSLGIIAVFFMMEVAQGEQGYPCPFIMTDAMDEEKEQSNTVPDLSRNGVHHPSCMDNCNEPVIAWHLLLCEICPRPCGPPVAAIKIAVRKMVAHGACFSVYQYVWVTKL